MPSLEMKVPPVAVFAVAAALAWFIAGRPAHFLWSNVAVGAVLSVIGIVIALLGVFQFRSARTTVDPRKAATVSALVTTGIYARSRNPMYLGLALVLAGWVMVLGNVWAGIVLPAFVDFLTRFQIEPEEKLLRQTFGAAFDAYTTRVRRWI